MPTFTGLREACLKWTVDRLQLIEDQIKQLTLDHSTERDQLIDEAKQLLRDLDHQFEAAVERHRIEDPDYAADHGLSLTHFTVDSGERKGDWMLLASNWGLQSKSLTESDPDRLTSLHRSWLQDFCGGQLPPVVAFKRRKTMLERQPRAVKELKNTRVLVPDPKWKILWGIILGAAYFALFLFLAVGIVATTTTFSSTFVRVFFWIAIIWTVSSSLLLAWVVRAFGASGRDCMGAFLAAVAIWLVVIQIGQTHLSIQAPNA